MPSRVRAARSLPQPLFAGLGASVPLRRIFVACPLEFAIDSLARPLHRILLRRCFRAGFDLASRRERRGREISASSASLRPSSHLDIWNEVVPSPPNRIVDDLFRDRSLRGLLALLARPHQFRSAPGPGTFEALESSAKADVQVFSPQPHPRKPSFASCSESLSCGNPIWLS